MDFPPGSWAFGTYEERLAGGYPLRLLADSVLPYSVPPVEARPDWWEEGAAAQFQEGYERNMAGDLAGLPNFPNSRYLNAVLVNMIGLRQSPSAPFRFMRSLDQENPVVSRPDNVWPFDEDPENPTFTPVSALQALEWYAEAYLASGTKLIVVIPERDVMNAIGRVDDLMDEDTWSTTPNNAVGTLAIINYVFVALKPTSEGGLGLADSIIGWYLIDEPDIFPRHLWARPDRLVYLRAIINETEIAARDLYEPGFAELSIEQKRARLRPVIITLTFEFEFTKPTIVEQPEIYANAVYVSEVLGEVRGVADIYGFDWYPWKRAQAVIDEDYPDTCDPPPPPNEEDIYKLADPVRSLRTLQHLRLRLNPIAKPGNTNYLPVFLWQQTDGWPFHDASVTPSSNLSPSTLGSLHDVDICGVAVYRRTKRYPNLREQQFYNWGGLLELSEGTCGFSQTNAPDDRLRDEFSRVAHETEYFAGLRYNSIDRSLLITGKQLTFGVPNAGDPRDSMPPRILYLDYVNQPLEPLGPYNRWLIIVNRHFMRLTGSLTFSPATYPGAFAFQRIYFMEPVGSPIWVSATRGYTIPIDVPGYGVFIYQQRWHVGANSLGHIDAFDFSPF